MMARKKIALLAFCMMFMFSGCGQSSSSDFVSVRDVENQTSLTEKQSEETTADDESDGGIIQQIPIDDIMNGESDEEMEYFILDENQTRVDEVIYERLKEDGEDSRVFYYEGKETELTIPADVKDEELGDNYHVVEVGDSAFSENETIERVVLPDTVKKIGEEAFIYCTSLTKITLPEKMEDIGGSAFFGCDSLTAIVIPEGITTIYTDTFSNCNALKEIQFPSTLKTIEAEAFWYCEALETLELPEGLETIGERVFYNCSSLKTVTFPDTLKDVSADIFQFCDQLETVYVPADRVSEYEELFAGAPFAIAAK